jgi:peptide/nickel transport system substrate-binding protein
MRRSVFAAIFMGLILAGPAHAAGTLRIALQEDPDALDPAQGGTFVGRVVFAALCDKLVDIGQKLEIRPQLAVEWAWSTDNLALSMKLRPGVLFHDGERFDATAVKINLERYKSAPESRRKAEVKAVKEVEVIDPLTVRIVLTEPYAPLLSVLADRAGMMMSPKALAAAGDKIAANPVCAGPFKFVERVAQERIVVERFDNYWNKGAIALDKIVYVPVPDTSVRLANLKSGAFEIIERVAATDLPAIRSDARLKLVDSTALGYYTMTINLANGPDANNPVAKNPKVREALEWSIDRKIINQVVFNGEFVASNQPEAPGTTYYASDRPVPPRDVARAKALLAEAGLSRVPLTIVIPNSPVDTQVAQVVQSMAAEAGFDIQLQATEANTLTSNAGKGNYQAAIVLWSGRPDPDGNVSIWLACDGFLNWGKYCSKELDETLTKARSTTATAERAELYRQAVGIYTSDRPHLFLYHFKWFWGASEKVDGFLPYPDGIIRLQGMKLRP